jgi:hypothetical protein
MVSIILIAFNLLENILKSLLFLYLILSCLKLFLNLKINLIYRNDIFLKNKLYCNGIHKTN